MAWMRETRIRIFMQMELKACLDEVDWMRRCHSADFNCPQEQYPSRQVPIPPDYIDNLQSRLINVNKGILPSTLKMIIKTYYRASVLPQQQEMSSRSQEEHLKTSLELQPDDITGNHRGGEHNPLEMVVDGTSSTDQGEYFVFQTEVGMNLETLQVAARHFALPIDRQRREVTTTSTERGETTPLKQTSGGTRRKRQQHESPPARRLQSAGISEGRHRLSRTSSSTLGEEE